MKKSIFVIMILLGLGLIISGCSQIMNVSVPTMEIERSSPIIECGNNNVTNYVEYTQGTVINGGQVASGRSNPANAYGELDGTFFTVGFGGYIILDFGQLVGGCINVFEISPQNGTYHGGNYFLEKAEVYVTDDLSNGWDFLGIAQNQRDNSIPVIFDPDGANVPTGAHPNVFPLDGCIRYVKIVDITDIADYTQFIVHDGFDVDAVYAGECIINVPLDIKPTSCPNPVNLKSKGVLPVAILGTEDFDVAEIDPVTVLLEGVAPLRWALEDVATPYEPYTGKEDCMDCDEYGPDGYNDLTFKFDKEEIIAALGEVEDGDCLVLTIQGELFDGISIYGEDVIKVLKKGK